jgi:hypothetical protein
MSFKYSGTRLNARRRAFGPLQRDTRPAEPTMSLSGALGILRTAPTDVRAVLEHHRAVLLDGRTAIERDETLNDNGRDVRRAELREQTNAGTARAAAELRAAVLEAHASLTARARAKRPTPATGVEALMARQIRWNRVREMLDADVPLDEVIAETTDPETLHALAEELPSYLRIKGHDASAATVIGRAVDDQLAHVAGGKALEAHIAAREAEALMGQVAPLLDQMDAVGAGADVGGAVIGAIRAEAAAPAAALAAVQGVTVPDLEAEDPDELPDVDDGDGDDGADVPAA